MKFKNNSQLNDKLRKLRKFYGIKMEELAQKLGMGSANNYHSYEIGRSYFTLDHVNELAKTYNIALDALIDNNKELQINDLLTKTIEKIDIEDSKESETVIKLLKNFNSLDDKTKSLVNLFIEKVVLENQKQNDTKLKKSALG